MTVRHAWARASLPVVAMLSVLWMLPAHAGEPPWKPSPMTYSAQGKSLRQVFADIAVTQTFTIVADPSVRGDVRGEFDRPAKEVFENMISAYDLVWFFDGSVLYVSAATDSRSEVVQTAPMSPAMARQALQRLGLLEARFPVRTSRGALLVTGPRRYVDLVVQAIAAEREYAASEHDRTVEARGAASSGTAGKEVHRQIMVFPLLHAQAQDTQLRIGDIQRTVLGVASILRSLLDDDAPLAGKVEPRRPGARRMPGVLAEGKHDHDMDDDKMARAPRRQGGIRIEADVRSNAVLVYDAPSTRAYYKETIASLDKPGRQVRLDVAIIDIASSALRDLGINLGIGAKRAVGQTMPSIGQAGGGEFQLMLGSSAAQFTARIAALEQAGKARIMSRPSVHTLDNVAAVIGNQATAYARVAGANATDLFPITSGLRVDITPQIIPTGEVRPAIRLFIGIQDGRLDPANVVDGLPVSSDNYISTQARVMNGDTLLFGGYRYDHVSHEQSGVPGLRSARGVGSLFRRTLNQQSGFERLFLVTPQIVDESVPGQINVDAMAAGDPTRVLPAPPRVPPIPRYVHPSLRKEPPAK